MKKSPSKLLFSIFFVAFFISCASSPNIEDSNKAETHYKMGYSFFQDNDLKKAYVEFQQVLELDPRHKGALNATGLVLMSREFAEYEDAVNYLNRAISIDPDYSEALNNLGVVYVRMEKWDRAIRYFKRALENQIYLSPDKAYSNLGYAYYKKGDYVNAENTLKKAISRYSNFPQHFYILGLVYMKTGKTRAAIDEFNNAVKLEHRFIEAHWELANAYLRVGDSGKAADHFKIVAERNGSNERGQEALKYLELLKR